MARIPQFTRTILLDRSNAGNIEASAAAFGGNQARGLRQDAARTDRNTEVLINYSDQQLKQEQAEQKVYAQQVVNQKERELIKAKQEFQLKRQSNPTGAAQEYDAFFTKTIEDTAAQYQDENFTGQKIDVDYFRQTMDKKTHVNPAIKHRLGNWNACQKYCCRG